ncbi:MAG: DUF2358 domain-containing protein [Oscillatoriales cyanobacterium C42_A2020_001]|nr:DUF2358 domain-containing protein [Leptolyngbyaceae cyanobacterium C42_A2020_001]
MNILEVLQADYARFPQDQTYEIYAEDVYFKDPMTQFRGRDRYQAMIVFIQTWFLNCHMDVHNIQQNGNQIRSDWTLSWNTPLPWKPHIAIPGWSELTLNDEGLITSHVDYWHCSWLDVLKQHFSQGHR